MTNFDRVTTANLEVALERVCRELPGGGDHAEKLLQAVESGHKNLSELEAVGRKALLVASRKSA
jgi:hypothetical protein